MKQITENKIVKRIMGGGNYYLTKAFYAPLLLFLFHNNIWLIYRSYHKKPALWKKVLWNRYMELHAASISIDAKFASPLILPHGVSGIFITQSAIVGKDCVVFQQVTIGANTIKSSKSYGAPTVGDSVYIGAGAKIIGNVSIGNNARIGANAVIVKDVPENTLAVIPAIRLIKKEVQLNNYFYPYLE